MINKHVLYKLGFTLSFLFSFGGPQDEMLVFMEYCDRGTLEEAARMGLPEHNIRVYTKEILLAINHLHENNILHRDIKGIIIMLLFRNEITKTVFGC